MAAQTWDRLKRWLVGIAALLLACYAIVGAGMMFITPAFELKDKLFGFLILLAGVATVITSMAYIRVKPK